jgi:AraC-like DNA-binding protein
MPPPPAAEHARYWRRPEIPEVDLFRAYYVHHKFARHTHDDYTFAVIEAGVEEFRYRGSTHRAGPGGLVLIEPGEVHTGEAGVPEGCQYRTLYPSFRLVNTIGAELGLRGTPAFQMATLDDPATVARVWRAYLAVERGDPLSASSLLRTSIAHVLRGYARSATRRRTAAPPRSVAEAQGILHARLTDPPRLEELAVLVGAEPFALVRAFREVHGLPPHAYLNQVRVRAARVLLAGGVSPAEVAARVGFADQAHLTRHFKRHVGVPPGAYQRGVTPGRSGPPARTFKTAGVGDA